MIRLFLRDGINSLACAEMRLALSAAPMEDVTLHVDSNGGSIPAALAMAAALRAHRGGTTAMARGRCESAAMVIFAACRQRIAASDATFLLHSAAFSLSNYSARVGPKELQAMEAELRASTGEMARSIQQHTDAPLWWIMDQQEQAKPFGAFTAVRAGLCHRILGDTAGTSLAIAAKVASVPPAGSAQARIGSLREMPAAAPSAGAGRHSTTAALRGGRSVAAPPTGTWSTGS